MNMHIEKRQLEDIPEFNEIFRQRCSAVQRERIHNGDIKNIKEENLKTEENKVNNNSQTDFTQFGILKTDSVGDKDGWILCDYFNLPTWMQHNDCLLSGYRPPLPSVTACFRSMFRFHTETVNIWTHLIGCICFIFLAIFTLTRIPNIEDRLGFTPFFIGAILCLGFSCVFHILHCHSPQVLKVFSRLDYCGIALLIMGSTVSWLYFCFYCHFQLKMFYVILTFIMGVCAVTVSLLETFATSHDRPLRAAVFITFGLSGTLPAVHFLVLEGWILTIHGSLIGIASLYILAATLYACRIPEKLLPGKCNIWFSSHQIFHTLVVIATLLNYQGIRYVYDRTLTTKCY